MMLSKVWPQFSKSRAMEEDCSGDSSSTRKVAKWLRRPNGPRCEVDRRSFSAQIQRLEHSEALFSQRIVDPFTHIVDDPCWAVLRVVGWPVGQGRPRRRPSSAPKPSHCQKQMEFPSCEAT